MSSSKATMQKRKEPLLNFVLSCVCYIAIFIIFMLLGLISSLFWQLSFLAILLFVTAIGRTKSATWIFNFFLLGSGIIAGASTLLEYLFESYLRFLNPIMFDIINYSIIAPLIEETLKVLPIVIILLTSDLKYKISITDVLLACTACGCGFDFTEESLMGKTLAGQTDFKIFSIPIFPLESKYGNYYFAGHGIYPGLIGLSIGFTRFIRGGAIKWIIPIIFWIWTVLDHGIWNYVVAYPPNPVISIIYALDLNGRLITLSYYTLTVGAIVYEYWITRVEYPKGLHNLILKDIRTYISWMEIQKLYKQIIYSIHICGAGKSKKCKEHVDEMIKLMLKKWTNYTP